MVNQRVAVRLSAMPPPLLLLLLPPLLALLLAAPTLVRRLHRGRLSLDDKVVVVTGAGRGLGRRLARQIFCAASRATLVLLDVDAAALAEARESLLRSEGPARRGNRTLTFECDVGDERCVAAPDARAPSAAVA